MGIWYVRWSKNHLILEMKFLKGWVQRPGLFREEGQNKVFVIERTS